jgi:hypothetical protein
MNRTAIQFDGNSRLFEESEEFMRSLNNKHKIWEQIKEEKFPEEDNQGLDLKSAYQFEQSQLLQ